MLTHQGCCKHAHHRERFRSESKRAWDQAPFSLTEQPLTSPTTLTSSAHPVLSANTSHTCSEEDAHSQLWLLTGLRGGPLPLPSPLAFFRTHVLFPCVRKFPTVPFLLSLLPGPHASASASVSGLCYNYGLLCFHPHRVSETPHFRHSCKCVS